MENTSLSLLDQLRSTGGSGSWNRLLKLYGPLIQAWLHRYDVQPTDRDDLLQEVLLAVAKDIDRFEHRGHPGAFRGWLKQILLHRLRKHWRARDRRPQAGAGAEIEARLAELEDPVSGVSLIWNREHDEYVLRHLLDQSKTHFEPATWQSFCRVALDGEKPASVAKELGLSLNAVCLAKSRVLRRLREEAGGLIDSSAKILPKSGQESPPAGLST